MSRSTRSLAPSQASDGDSRPSRCAEDSRSQPSLEQGDYDADSALILTGGLSEQVLKKVLRRQRTRRVGDGNVP
jgi:hypothetical protein